MKILSSDLLNEPACSYIVLFKLASPLMHRFDNLIASAGGEIDKQTFTLAVQSRQ